MKKFLIIVFALSLFLSIGCSDNPNKVISEEKAKGIITSLYQGSTITDVFLNTEGEKATYEVFFAIDNEEYVGYVNAKSGSVTLVEEAENRVAPLEVNATESEPEAETESETESEPGAESESEAETESKASAAENTDIIAEGKALNIAKTDSGASDPAILIKNEYSPQDNTYNIVFKDNTKEYVYIINALTGEIISKEVEIDS